MEDIQKEHHLEEEGIQKERLSEEGTPRLVGVDIQKEDHLAEEGIQVVEGTVVEVGIPAVVEGNPAVVEVGIPAVVELGTPAVVEVPAVVDAGKINNKSSVTSPSGEEERKGTNSHQAEDIASRSHSCREKCYQK